ncbi:hypothetical protein K440DRAFT_641482 [Wilcoxina mikolae CBS 423.85]|nr:hypothetical protein K440DRAFT_641482 [Wilcoxina mikolae CBS 423.85]
MGRHSGEEELRAALDSFHEALTEDQKTQLSAIGKPTASAVVELTENIDAKKPKSSRRVLGFLQSFQQFSAVVDTFIQSNPVVSALVWGSVKFLILASLNYLDYFDKLSDMLQKLGYLCPTLERIKCLFPDSPELCDLIASFYATAIAFCTKAHGIKQVGKSLWKPFKLEFQDIENRLHDQRERIDLEITAASETVAFRERQAASLYRKRGEVYRALQLTQHEENRGWHIAGMKRHQENRQWQILQTERKIRKQLLARISNYDYRGTFSRALHKRCEGTGNWLMDTEEFKKWYEEDCSSILWYHGIPVSFIRQILNVFENISPELNDYLQGLFMDVGSLADPNVGVLFQALAQVELLADTSFFIVDGLDECNDSERRQLLWNLKLLGGMSNRRIKVVVSSREEVDISSFLRDHSHEVPLAARAVADIGCFIRQELNQRIEDQRLIVGRQPMIQNIQDALVAGSDGMFLWVAFQLDELCLAKNDEDIHQILRVLPRGLNETYGRVLQRIIRDRDPEVAFKIFRWIATSKRPPRPRELLEAIALEPGDTQWQQFHARMYLSGERMIQNCSNLVTVNAIEGEDTIVMFAHHTVLEFLTSANPHIGTPGFSFLFNIRDASIHAASVCLTYRNLADFETQVATLPTQDTQLKLSALDLLPTSGAFGFLMRLAQGIGFIRPRLSQRKVGFGRLLPALQSAAVAPEVTSKLKQNFGLFEYVSMFWIHHCACLRENDEPLKRFRAALENTVPAFPVPWATVTDQRSGDPSEKPTPEIAAIRWAVENRHRALFELFITLGDGKLPLELLNRLYQFQFQDHSNRVLTPGYVYERLAVAAASNGHVLLLEYLQEFSVFLNQVTWPNALIAASSNGHLGTVSFLIENIPFERDDVAIASCSAAENGELSIVLTLLQLVHPDEPDSFGRTTLVAAAQHGHLHIVDVLLNFDAKDGVRIQNKGHLDNSKRALNLAAENGHLDVVDRLLTAVLEASERGDDSDRISIDSLIQLAKKNGHSAVVKRLKSAAEVANLRGYFTAGGINA